ncbi:twisted gastrulation protein homolog 1-A-like isoform X1 [Amphibalanus amphitrite]|nr:twisted gastrulation protein homolog 1-A-like isoform X1 [Amphibalanus amphitrite]XP_043234218.1 twisted gastrulation protein homolog 1-A-like isoform X1 [Amphibalanus amphitrite]XP_043243326.1 twisted gastrulation protein homolog 1-A-like isoform X1 [Amphibalanus amphitrite]
MEPLRTVSAAVCLLLALWWTTPGLACNEAVCASIVSKCMLTGSCKCDMTDLSNCTCCKECSECLDNLYEECCYCFKMCPKPERSWSDLAMHSEVEEFHDPEIGLFSTLTNKHDPKQRWISYTFPVDHQIVDFGHKYQIRIVSVDESAPEGGTEPQQVTVNCTVAYLTQCRSWAKCSFSCQTMGARSVRWFHNGCCECIGSTCINFGINESRCLGCSDGIEDMLHDEGELSDDQLDQVLMAEMTEV